MVVNRRKEKLSRKGVRKYSSDTWKETTKRVTKIKGPR